MNTARMRTDITRLAIPSIISNITVPLLGMLDVVIVGHLSEPSYIGAIAIGSMMFSLLYWGFGFLRMGTGGLTAQAFGRKDPEDIKIQLLRPLLIALVTGLMLIMVHRPLEHLIFMMTGEDNAIACHYASVYFRILIWGAPASLSVFVLNGWFVGIQKTSVVMFISLLQNIMNIIFSLFFVYVLSMEIEGVALGTLLGQWTGALAGILLASHQGYGFRSPISKILDSNAISKYFKVNSSIFGRTLCLIAVTVSFTTFGARQGDTILDVNTLMMQFFTIFSYVMDGYAYAAESLCGSAYGSGDRKELGNVIASVFRIGWVMVFLFSVGYYSFNNVIMSLFTDKITILSAAQDYSLWPVLIPLCGFSAFLWDGVYIGMTWTKGMLLTMMVAMCTYFAAYASTQHILGNHGLWVAFLLYLLVRGLGQWIYFRRNFKYS